MCSLTHATRRSGALLVCLLLSVVVAMATFGPVIAADDDAQTTAAAETTGVTAEVVKPSINLRGGPGTTYEIVGTASQGDVFPVIGKNAAGSWYQIEASDGALVWVAAFLVELSGGDAAELPVVDAPELVAAPVTPAAPAEEALSQAEPMPAETDPVTVTTSVATTESSATIAPGMAPGKLLYTVANDDAERWELWEFDFATATSTKIGDWRMMIDMAPDGKQMAYVGAPTDDDAVGVWITDGALSNDRRLSGGFYPSFSPGGDRLAVMDGAGSVWIVISDGEDGWELTTGEYPAWSPTGNAIALRSCVGGSCGIYVIDADSKDPNAKQQLTTGGSDGQPAWSPDGKGIAYISKEDGNFEIYGMKANGTKKVRLTDNPTTDGLPVWSPDGEWLAFRSDRDGVWGIYIMRADGSDVYKVTDAPVLEYWVFEKMDWR